MRPTSLSDSLRTLSERYATDSISEIVGLANCITMMCQASDDVCNAFDAGRLHDAFLLCADVSLAAQQAADMLIEMAGDPDPPFIPDDPSPDEPADPGASAIAEQSTAIESIDSEMAGGV